MTLNELAKAVAEAQLGNPRMTDVVSGTHTISIDGEKVFLVSDKKVKVPISIPSLASLRIVTSEANAKTAANTREARTNENYKPFQAALAAEGGVKLDANTKFTVVHRLPIVDSITGETLLRNENYKGYPEYVKSARKASAMPSVTPEQITARNNAFTEASEALHASGYKAGIAATEKTSLMLPVFTVS